jgi:hypothetical protein
MSFEGSTILVVSAMLPTLSGELAELSRSTHRAAPVRVLCLSYGERGESENSGKNPA